MVIKSIHLNKVALKVHIHNVLFRALLLDTVEIYIGQEGSCSSTFIPDESLSCQVGKACFPSAVHECSC